MRIVNFHYYIVHNLLYKRISLQNLLFYILSYVFIYSTKCEKTKSTIKLSTWIRIKKYLLNSFLIGVVVQAMIGSFILAQTENITQNHENKHFSSFGMSNWCTSQGRSHQSRIWKTPRTRAIHGPFASNRTKSV